jgi:raffinose/stachyose/melibiose transport system substrate-binding protein
MALRRPLRIWPRRIAALPLAVVAAAALFGCAPSTEQGDNSGDGQKTTLTVWSWRTEDSAAYEKIFAEYEKSHKDVDVQFKPFKNTEYNTVLQNGLAGEGGPDIAQLRAYGALQSLIRSKSLVELDGKVDTSGFDDTVLAAARGKTDGKLYGVPVALQTMQIYYNKKVFSEHGLDVPETWEQLLGAAAKLEGAGVVPFATTGKDSWMLPILVDTFGATRYGGKEFEEAILKGSKQFTAPEFVGAIDALRQVSKYFPDDVAGVAYTDSQVLFTTGKAAMFPGGSFELGFFQRQNPSLELGVFSAPPPPGAVADGPLVPGWADASYGVSARSKNQDKAIELVKWMATKEFGQLFTDEIKQISPAPGVTPSDPLLAEMVKGYQERPASYLLLVNFRYGEPTGTDLLGAGVQKMLLGQADPAKVAADLQQGVAQWFKPGG